MDKKSTESLGVVKCSANVEHNHGAHVGLGFSPVGEARIDDQPTVQVRNWLLLMDVQGFKNFSPPVVPFPLSCLGRIPVHLVLVSSGNSILGVFLLHSILVLT